MTRALIASLAILFLFTAHAAPVTVTLDSSECWTIQHDGVTAFQATGVAPQQPPYTTVNYTGTCGAPPPPVNDPNALNIISGQFTQHACPRYSTATGQDFAQLFGRGEDGSITSTWAYRPSTSLELILPPHGRYYGGLIFSGQNPGITPHYLKGNSYAGSCTPPFQVPQTARVSVRVVAVGTMTVVPPGCTSQSCWQVVQVPPPVGRCSIDTAAFDNNAWIQLKFAGPQNTAHCLGVIGGTYRYIVENAGSANLIALLTWN